MTSNFEKVQAFMRKFKIVDEWKRDGEPHLLDDKSFLFRYHLIAEETHELLKAHRKGDIVEMADALADLLYVVYGMADLSAIPIDAVFAEVHRANMTKVRSRGDDDPLGKRNSKLDVVKPAGFKPPDVAKVLKLVHSDG